MCIKDLNFRQGKLVVAQLWQRRVLLELYHQKLGGSRWP